MKTTSSMMDHASGRSDNATHQQTDRKMLEFLVCPVTHGGLSYDRQAQELISRAAKLAFPVRDGVPIMLIDEARHLSLEEMDRLKLFTAP